MILPMIADWFNTTMAFLFIAMIDTVCYGLLSVAYNIFYAVAQIDLFGGGTAGQLLYTEITKRLYMILSIIMIFVFAYQLIMLIVNPDGKSKGASSQVVKDTLLSIVLLIVLPLIYRYMSMFQFHVLENNTIPAIILGTNGGSETENPGKSVATMVLVSFFHPNGTTYNTFYDENGKIRSDAEEQCLADTEAEDGEEHPTTCEHYIEALESWTEKAGVTALTTGDKKLRHWVGDTMTYTWILSSVAALAIAWVFFLYAIDIGVRAVKLGVLQLISPVPVILKIFPNTKKSYETWFNHMKKTYLELFIRVAIIFFALEIVKLIPVFIGIIFESQSSSVAGPFTKCVATVILIFGILKFGQEAPGLFKEIFSTGGNLFSGLKLNPLDPKSRITDNKAAMWGIGKGAAAVGGAKSQYTRTKSLLDDKSINAENQKHGFRNALLSMPSALRGIATGLKQKDTTPTDITGAALKQTVVKGADAANKQYDDSTKLQKKTERLGEYIRHATPDGTPDSVETPRDVSGWANIKGYMSDWKTAREEIHDDKMKEKRLAKEQYQKRISGEYSSTNSTAESLTKIVDGLKALKSKTDDKTKSLTKEIDELQRIINSSTVRTNPGEFNKRIPDRREYADEAAYEMAKDMYKAEFESHLRRQEEFKKFEEATAMLAQKKIDRNEKIATELSSSAESRKFATEQLTQILDEIRKSPVELKNAKNEKYEDKVRDLIDTVSNPNATLSADDAKSISTMIDELSKSMVYTKGSDELNKQKTSNLNAAPKADSASKPASGGSGDKK